MKRTSLEEIRRLKGQTDWTKLEQAGDYAGPAEIDIDWDKAEVVEPQKKIMISVRLDEDVLTFLKKQGRGYQTRINAILRSYMDAKSH